MIAMHDLSITLLAVSLLQVSSNGFAKGDRPVSRARDYEVHELTLNGDGCGVATIEAGVAVGRCFLPGRTAARAFIWTQVRGVVDIGTLGGSLAGASDVDGRRVVGWSEITGDTATHAFSWTAEEGMLDLGTAGELHSMAHSVSGDVVVGELRTAAGNMHAFLWTPTSGMIDLPRLAAGTESIAREVHNGLISGFSATNGSDSRSDRPVAWKTDGQLIDVIGEPIEFDENGWVRGIGQADGVSNGLVIGHRLIMPAFTFRAFAWREDQGLIDLGLIPGSTESSPFDTDGRWVVGHVSGPGLRAFVWDERRGMKAITPASMTAQATHVSNGRVVGIYSTDAGFMGTFLWTREGGLVDVTPLDFPSGTVPVGIDADGRIAVSWSDPGLNYRSAILIPKRRTN
jgi:probable HAF family extracellular repeat protein